MEPSASSLAAEEAPTSVDRAIVKPNKGKEKIEEPSHELESFPLTAAPEMYSPWTAAYGGLITIANPLHIRVGTLVHLVVVTNNADEASEWVRSLSPEFPNRNRIIGLSSYRTVYSRHDGYIYRHVVSLHLSCASRVLIYYMDPPVTTFYSRDVLDFLHHPSNIFVGFSVDETLYLLGAPYRIGAPEAIELDRVAEILGVENLMSISRATGLQPHIVLAYNFLHLPIEDLRSTRTPERIIEWPPTQVHVDFAVETAVISQMLGNRARLRLRAQAQPPEEN